MGKREEFIAKVKKLMYQPERIRNIGIVALQGWRKCRSVCGVDVYADIL